MKLLKWIDDHFEKYFLIISLIVMVVLIFAQVVMRFFERSAVWIEEMARYIMLYQIWIGAAYAVKEEAHIRITSLRDALQKEKGQKLELVVLLIWLTFSIWLCVEGFKLVQIQRHIGQTSPAMQVPMEIPYFSVPLGGFLMSVRLIQKIREKLIAFNKEV